MLKKSLYLLICTALLTIAANINGPVYAETGSDCAVIKADNIVEFSRATEAGTETFLEVDKRTGKVDGESFRGVFGEKYDKDKAVEQIESEDMYVVTGEDASSYEVTSLFGIKRLIILEEIDELEGAQRGATYNGETILEYATEEETKDAYDRLIKKYGADKVIVDLPIKTESAKGWGTERMNLDCQTIKMQSQSNAPVTVAVIDTGVTVNHEIFKDTTILSSSKSFVSYTSSYADDHGHGTMCAGIIAESTPKNVRLLILKALPAKGSGSSSDVRSAVIYAKDQNVDVISMSLGSSEKEYKDKYSILYSAYYSWMNSPYKDAVNKNILICAAAGNENSNLDTDIYFPAVSEYTYAIGALDTANNKASYSNYGSGLDFCAPGSNVQMAEYGTTKGYVYGSGTSMATPYVAACCAMLKMENKSISFSGGKTALRNISVDLGTAGKDIYYGYGLPVFPKGSIAARTMEISPTSYWYNGSPKTPSVRMPNMVQGKDYNVSYSNNVDAGTASVIISGAGGYTGSILKEFEIKQLAIKPTITLSEYSYVHDGIEKKPGVSISYGGKDIDPSQYTVSYPQESINPGTYEINVEMRGNYKGSASQQYVINPDTPILTLKQYTYVYNGLLRRPSQDEITVKYLNKTLKEGIDYTVSRPNNSRDVGVYEIKAELIGDYATIGSIVGPLEAHYVIEPKAAEVELDLGVQSYVYNGYSRRPSNIVVRVNSQELDSTQYILTEPKGRRDVGEYEYLVELTGNYVGYDTASFVIEPKDVEPIVELSQCEYIYDGTSKRPDVTIRDGTGKTYSENEYIVIYPLDEKNCGSKAIHVEMTGNYTGRGTASYTVVPKVITPRITSDKDTFVYNGEIQKPVIRVFDDEKELSEFDYLVSFDEESKEVGSYELTVNLIGNYSGRAALNYKIEPANQDSNNNSNHTNGDNPDKERLGDVDRIIVGMNDNDDPKGSVFKILRLRSTKQTDSSIKLDWKHVGDATKYAVYGNACGKNNPMKRIALLDNSTTSKKITEVVGKKLKKGTYYKFVIVALDKDDKALSKSKTIHVATKGGKNGNHKSVKVSNAKKFKKGLKQGKRLKIKAKAVGKKVKKHVKLRYESSNPAVATVSASGKVKAVGKGSATIIVYAQNGVFKNVKVKVK